MTCNMRRGRSPHQFSYIAQCAASHSCTPKHCREIQVCHIEFFCPLIPWAKQWYIVICGPTSPRRMLTSPYSSPYDTRGGCPHLLDPGPRYRGPLVHEDNSWLCNAARARAFALAEPDHVSRAPPVAQSTNVIKTWWPRSQ